MPNSQHYYSPDAIDCDRLCHSLGEDFGCFARLEVEYALDYITVICRVYKGAGEQPGVVQVQSIVRAPLKSKRDLYVMHYSALLDCWHQLDRGVLAVATAPIEHYWNGRPKVPAKHVK